MWLTKIANPIMRFILCSPFHKMLSDSLLLITYRGKKSGKTYTLPVNYAQVDNIIYIVPGMHEKKIWWRNLRGGAPVTLTLGGRSVSGSALVWEDDVESIAEALGYYARRFPPSARMHGVRMEPDGTCNPEDLLKAAQSILVVKVDVEPAA